MKEQTKTVWVSAITAALVAGTLSVSGLIVAGDLDPPPGVPAPTMKTQDEIPPTWSQKLDASERFVLVMNNQAVLDKETGLVWERSPDTTARDWYGAGDHCFYKQIDGRMGWRLPTIEELASLMDTTQTEPALPLGHPFSGVQSIWPPFYWSSTAYALEPDDQAWGVDLDDAIVAPVPKWSGGNPHAWCVRGGPGHDGPRHVPQP